MSTHIAELIKKLAWATDTYESEIAAALKGVCFDEETASDVLTIIERSDYKQIGIRDYVNNPIKKDDKLIDKDGNVWSVKKVEAPTVFYAQSDDDLSVTLDDLTIIRYQLKRLEANDDAQ